MIRYSYTLPPPSYHPFYIHRCLCLRTMSHARTSFMRLLSSTPVHTSHQLLFTLWPLTPGALFLIIFLHQLLHYTFSPSHSAHPVILVEATVGLTLPEGSDLLEIASPNSSAVIFRGKLLLFVHTSLKSSSQLLRLSLLARAFTYPSECSLGEWSALFPVHTIPLHFPRNLTPWQN